MHRRRRSLEMKKIDAKPLSARLLKEKENKVRKSEADLKGASGHGKRFKKGKKVTRDRVLKYHHGMEIV